MTVSVPKAECTVDFLPRNPLQRPETDPKDGTKTERCSREVERARQRRIERGESQPLDQRTAPGGRVRATSHPWGEAAGKHLQSDPRIPPRRTTSALWTQAERDRYVARGIAPEQLVLWEVA